MSEPMEFESEPLDEGAEQAPAELPLSQSEVPQGDAGEPPAEPGAPAGPTWFERQSTYQSNRRSGWAERQRQIREENRRYKGLEERHAQIEARNKELLAAATQLLQRQGAGQDEQFPDPTLDPKGFMEWWKQANSAGLNESLKPILDHVEAQRQMIEELQQGRAAEEEDRRFLEAETQRHKQALAEYHRDEPELAAGSQERFLDGRDLLRECYEAIGCENPQQYADRLLYSVAASARATGDNEIAALDGFISALYYGISRRMVEAGFLERPFMPAGAAPPGNGAAVPGNGNRPGRPIMTEARRQEEVRRRAAAAGSMTAREPAAGPPAARSEAQEMYDQTRSATGQVDWGKVRAAALRDCNGNEKEAAALLAGLRPSR